MTTGQTPKLLVANRGEIAIRILRSATELGWRTVALYTEQDSSHATYADEAILLDSPARYMDPEHIADAARSAECSHVHPGYGFLSESPRLASLFASNGDHIKFVGPSVESLEIASDKMRSRELATSEGVPVAPGARVSSAGDVRNFTRGLGGSAFPIVIKALDGGGGRGIRLVNVDDDVEIAFDRCVGESASREVFVEKAFVGSGWRHVEVQIVGDGHGATTHLWERECSIQRRFQKVVESAPSLLPRNVVEPLIHAALKLARCLQYAGLGTFEFLVNGISHEWIFMEINPRIQVEHTVTEEIMDLDLIRVQLLLTLPGASLAAVLPSHTHTPPPPRGHAIQLRLISEDPKDSFRLCTGSIGPSQVSWPGGRGIRVDTWLCSGPNSLQDPGWTVGVDFDPLLAKIIVYATTFQEATARALRASREIRIIGAVKTNAELLAGILAHPDWAAGNVHTRWLEKNLNDVLRLGGHHLDPHDGQNSSRLTFHGQTPSPSRGPSAATATVLLQPGASFQLTLAPAGHNEGAEVLQKHNLVLSAIGHNAFPSQLSGTLSTSLSPSPLSFSLTQLSTVSGSADVEFAHPADPTHVASPIAGKVVELYGALASAVDGGEPGRGYVRQGEPLVVVSAMKMESVVNCPRSGRVVRMGKGIHEGAIIGEGALLCVLDVEDGPPSSSGKLARL
ncbi:hypothetical protein BD413DRAFT_514344 [Trametes elegans]|nr:hypothetical protein BD413DRAFT_514344 [Trametes elegans]